ncbi:hypothetical protein L596_009245 [Steinernema carpocapsae]|uniref:Uncharacterized protein n=1 Tax=Steinernema carpocapsae TaxID=34508 RepID=A0A4U5PEU0_STECR|nr:hypothetical protein L596_009245 [Steinernema carpocapsae]
MECVGAKELGNSAYNVCYELTKIKPSSNGQGLLHDKKHSEKVFIEHDSNKADLIARSVCMAKRIENTLKAKSQRTILVKHKAKANMTKSKSAKKGNLFDFLKEAGRVVVVFQLLFSPEEEK